MDFSFEAVPTEPRPRLCAPQGLYFEELPLLSQCAFAEVCVGLGRTVAVYHRSPTLYQIHEENRPLCFLNDDATDP